MFLRYNPGVGGYLVTMVPSATTDRIRIWTILPGGGVSQLGSEFLHDYSAGDKVWIKIVGSLISVYLDHGAGYELVVTRTDATYTGTGYIGIYAASAEGALDDFGGGNTP